MSNNSSEPDRDVWNHVPYGDLESKRKGGTCICGYCFQGWLEGGINEDNECPERPGPSDEEFYCLGCNNEHRVGACQEQEGDEFHDPDDHTMRAVICEDGVTVVGVDCSGDTSLSIVPGYYDDETYQWIQRAFYYYFGSPMGNFTDFRNSVVRHGGVPGPVCECNSKED